MYRLCLTLAALGLLAAMPASAQELPRFDVEGHCENVADSGGGGSNMIYNGCIDMEQEAYNELKGQWSSLPRRVRSHCTDVASVGGSGSYSTMKGCVDMEVEAGENRSTFEH